MATGTPKSRWQGDKNDLPEAVSSTAISLSYRDKQPETEVLALEPAQLQCLWSTHETFLAPNLLCFGDNLPIMARLLKESTIAGHVKLIYIDPPFSSNNVFQSRSQRDAYHDLLTGNQYLEFIRKRLIFLRELLADDGSIYVHIDDKMAFHIKIIMDELFGVRNFRNFITRRKCNPKNYTRKTYGNVSDYIFFYTKTDEYVWNRPYEIWTPERASKEYQYVEESTGRRYKKVPIHAPGERNGETGKPWRGMMPPPGKHWQYTPATLDEMDKRGEIYWSPNGNPRRKVYLDQNQGVPVQDIWLDVRDAHNQNIKISGYPTEKNPDLLTRIVEASSNPRDIVLDSFSGSGTTLAVAAQLHRKWIGMDKSPEAISTTLRRFASGLEPMGDFVSQRNGTRNMKQPQLFALEPEITDFSLYAAEPYENDLEEALNSWRTLFE